VEDQARLWTATVDPIRGLPSGEHTLSLLIRHGDGETVTERSVTWNASDPTASLSILNLFNFPNPFEDRTEFHYRLNVDAERARLTVFTLRGKRIRTMEAPARVNNNVVAWDGLDEDGDPVANGLYFYKLEIWDRQGETTSKIEKIVRAK
jgi:hypothetical protein